ncbi:metallophosphoesterase [Aquimarina sp. U1-2]|uniref:metallophosphoesterase n=1 Tax=Aquimarina sp. U1-2 TaxID=2823141 RepID=UPI001AECAAA7|nr:metallophosphoesterase [Aquimarina sp. U1-2]MBP2833951.1 metallophosphoesterase [Aquimarina sp. U1-2]
MNKYSKILLICTFLVANSCATYTPKYVVKDFEKTLPNDEIDQTFYLIGDAGAAKLNQQTKALSILQKVLDTANAKRSHVVFLGDNIYQRGMPKKNATQRPLAEHRINAQIDAVNDFQGNVIFIPGNHDWYAGGLLGLKRQEKYVEAKLDKKDPFLPENGCPLESISISDKVQLLILDTQWHLVNWDNHPTINDDCEIKTKEKFFIELEGELKKNSNKTIVLALHHPLYTNGVHGGNFTFDKHLFPFRNKIPLPGLGSLVTLMRSLGGVSTQDVSNRHYNRFIKRVSTMARSINKAIFISGHEHSLQFIDDDGVKQIVSGSGSKVSAVSLGKNGLFSYPDQGFAVVDIYKNGSSYVRFYANKNDQAVLVYQTRIHKKEEHNTYDNLPASFSKEISASIYEKDEVEKSSFFKFLWGDHYRQVYGKDITVPVATLDTLMGGLSIERQGGGQVTRSLRLVDKEGKRFSLRAMRKSVTQFLQKGAFKYTYLGAGFDGTYTEDVLSDFYTSSYPYAFLAVAPLADAIGVYHANPKLYYIPKHAALGKYNDKFGDELYFLEERPGKEFYNEPSFGRPDDIESTDNVFKKLRKDEKYQIDEAHYIRTRLFDMLLGDWDRHADQWRWARFDTQGTKTYRPIPRDRDQVFSNYDGLILDIVKFVSPLSRKFQVYDQDLKKVRWINQSGMPLDRALLQNSVKETWLKEAKYIKQNLSNASIDLAFQNIPITLQDTTIENIKRNLKARRDRIEDMAGRYYDYVSKHVVLTGTDKDDLFEIRREGQKTIIKVSRIKNGQETQPLIERVFDSKETNEIWLYGLDDDDEFLVNGNGKNLIEIRIIGGQGDDVYTIQNGKKIKIYDHSSKPNTITEKGGAKFRFSNTYDYNTYDFKKYLEKTNAVTPFLGFNPDDGINVNITNVYTIKSFKNDPYHSKHKIRAAYYFATEGYDLSYSGEFIKALGTLNITASGVYTSENFAQNFFGFGNETNNEDDNLGLDFNRVKIGTWAFGLGISKRGFNGAEFSMKANYEGIEVQNTPGRFITAGLDFIVNDPNFFERKFFANLDLKYTFENYDNPVNPTRGMSFSFQTGGRINVDDTDRMYGYLIPKLGFYNAITRNRKLVLKTNAIAHINIGDDFEFYQGAMLGGLNGLRGYREERFIGESALAFSGDLRYSFNTFKTGLLPLQLGIFSGYDIGRVWLDNENSNTWHDSIGGGFWINALDTIGGQLGLFNSDDGIRATFGFGLSF